MASHSIRIARVYDDLHGVQSGNRWLVDRVWPRGISREALELTGWAPEAAPSHDLRRWFGHDPSRWEEFRRRYLLELAAAPEVWRPLRDAADTGPLLLLYAAVDRERNNAVVLRDFLGERVRQAPSEMEGGEPVCWLDRVCPDCGRLAEDRMARSCPVCGEPLAR